MGKVLSTLARPFQLYNIEARAHKQISKERPSAAPSYPYAIKDAERANEEDPGFMEKQKVKDVQLDKHLKDIYVVAHNSVTSIASGDRKMETKTDRSLPEVRSSSDYPEYGYVEPDITEITQGKFTLKQAIKFITDHQTQPDVYKAQDIARDYKIDVKIAENIVKYFSMFDIHLPKKLQEKKEEMTLWNYYGKCKEMAENFYRIKSKELAEKGTEIEETKKSPTIIKPSGLQKKSSSDS